MAKKLKKFLKKAGKAAAIAAALYGATKLGGKKSKTAKNVLTGRDLNLRGKLASAMPDHLTSDLGASTYVTPKSSMPFDPHSERWPNKGGGIAKRGMGAAFKKGGHVKSRGVAKRGGGVEIK